MVKKKSVIKKQGFDAENKTAVKPQALSASRSQGLKPMKLLPALLLGTMLSNNSFAGSNAVDHDQWLSTAPNNGYTVQLATIYGHQQCLDFAALQSESTVCLQSSTVAKRWYAVSGVYGNYKSA